MRYTRLVGALLALVVVAGMIGSHLSLAAPRQNDVSPTPTTVRSASPSSPPVTNLITPIRVERRAPRRPANGTTAEGAASPGSTFILYGYYDPMNGWQSIRIYDESITPESWVYASASEIDGNNIPFLGAANISVANVVPGNGYIDLRINVDWGDPLPTLVNYLVMNY